MGLLNQAYPSLSNDGGRQAAVARGVNDLRIEDWISSGQPSQFAIENHHFEEVKSQVNHGKSKKTCMGHLYHSYVKLPECIFMGTGWDD